MLLRSILIDPYRKSVRPLRIGAKYPALRKVICGSIQGIRLSKNEILYVHDEGLYIPAVSFFRLNGPIISYPQPLAGYGVVLGVDDQGESRDTEVPVELIRDNVDFPDLRVRKWTSGRTYTETHPILGEVSVIEGPKPIFEVLKEGKA